MEKACWTDRVNGGGEQYRTYSKQRGRLTGLVTSCVGTAFWNRLVKER